MTTPSKLQPERGDARIRLLEAARDVIRYKGFATTLVDGLSEVVGGAKGAFLHHFESKEALGVAAAMH